MALMGIAGKNEYKNSVLSKNIGVDKKILFFIIDFGF